MKKSIMIRILSVMLLCLIGAFSFGCSCSDNTELDIGCYSLTLSLLDDYSFPVSTNGNKEDIEWKSEDENVVKVDGGALTPINVGKTTVIAKLNNAQSKCTVTIVDDNLLPMLDVSDSEVNLRVGESFKVSAALQYKNKECVGATYAYETENSDIASINENGVIVANALGETCVKIVASWKNVDSAYTTEYVTVRVLRDVDIVFNVNKLTLYAIDEIGGKTYDNEAVVSCEITADGEKISSEITYSVEDESVCSLTGNVVKGLKGGKTNVVASVVIDGFEYKNSIEAEICRPLAERGDEIYLERMDTDISYIFDNEKITDLTLYSDGKATNYTVKNNKIVSFSMDTGAVSVEVYNEKYGYRFENAHVVDLYVQTAEDVITMRNATEGLFVLGNDIDMKGTDLSVTKHTFTGTLDGNGKTIYNLNYDKVELSLFYTLSGTVKNLALANVSIGSGVQSGSLSIMANNATIDNCYIGVNYGGSNHSGGVSKYLIGVISIKNTIVNAASALSNNSGLLFGFSNSSNVSLKNTYAISSTDKNAKLVGGRGDGFESYRDTINSMNSSENVIVYYGMDSFEKAMQKGSVSVKNKTLYEIVCAPTPIKTVEEFLALRDTESGYYRLANDIDLSDVGYLEVGNNITFSGILDGNGYTVSGMKLATTTEGKQSNINGFFRTLSGTVKNITILNATLGAKNGDQGGVFACTIDGATFENVYIGVTFNSAVTYNGVLAKEVKGTLNMKDCVIAAYAGEANAWCGLLASFPSTSADKITLENTYFITESTMQIVGRNSGDFLANYTAINQAFENKIYTLEAFETAKANGIVTVKNEASYNKVTANVSTVEEFLALRSAENGYYRLANDIDLSNVGYLEVGNNITFSGILDGNGYTVSGMKLATTTEGKQSNINGFFRTLSGTVKNITILNATLGTKNGDQGGVFACTIDGATFENVYIGVTFNSAVTYNGVLAKEVKGTLNMKDCVIAAYAGEANAWCGLLASFPSTSADKITLENTYFITESTMQIVGRNNGNFLANYTAINQAFESNKYTHAAFETAKESGTVTVKNSVAYGKITEGFSGTNE